MKLQGAGVITVLALALAAGVAARQPPVSAGGQGPQVERARPRPQVQRAPNTQMANTRSLTCHLIHNAGPTLDPAQFPSGTSTHVHVYLGGQPLPANTRVSYVLHNDRRGYYTGERRAETTFAQGSSMNPTYLGVQDGWWLECSATAFLPG